MRKLLLLAAATSFLLVPAHTQAFDGARKGFILGLGAGYGSAKQTVSAEGASASSTENGIATSFKIGAGLSDKFLLYYSNRAVFFSVDMVDGTSHAFIQGMSALAGSYYLEPTGPSVFFTGELGGGIISDRDAEASDSGFGFGLGLGYDFGNHFVVEASFMRATVGSEEILGVTVDESVSNFTVTANWLGF